jgi:Transposase IS116/IS110/IS902 family
LARPWRRKPVRARQSEGRQTARRCREDELHAEVQAADHPAWWLRSAAAKCSRRGATSAPGSALFPSRHRPETAPILGRISKRGNRYLRVLFVQAAWVVLIRAEELGALPTPPIIPLRARSVIQQKAGNLEDRIAVVNYITAISWSCITPLRCAAR